MRLSTIIALLATVAVPVPVLAQTPPPGIPATPPVTADQAKSLYRSLDPAIQQEIKQAADQAKAQYGNDPGFKAWVKSILKSWFGK